MNNCGHDNELAETKTEREITIHVRNLLAQQKQNDERRQEMAHEIIDAIPPEDIYHVARGWVESAAQFCDNARYWEKRAREAEWQLDCEK